MPFTNSHLYKALLCLWALLWLCTSVQAQRRYDTLNIDSINIFRNSERFGKLMQQGLESISRNPLDTGDQAQAINTKSENPYKRFDGKIIRRITIKQLGFEQKVTDTNNRIIVAGTRLMNATHTTTKDWVVRQNLFIHEGTKLNPFRIADNERYLRTLEYMQDARIVVKRVKGSKDSVDVEVITRDLYSITGGGSISGLTRLRANVAEANLFGMAQKVQITTLADQWRRPIMGFEALYRKDNVFGSFIHASAGYTNINPNAFDGKEEEHAYFLLFDRPLVSPYSRFAGSLYLAHKFSKQAYFDNRPDSLFYKYRSNTMDGWVGYNVASQELRNSNAIRDRRFISVRYMQNYYDEVPQQVGNRLDPVFNDMQAYLAQITFFRQDFYKTNYVYGFGVTEDIPHGYNISVTGGWYRQAYLRRPYAGFNADRYKVTKDGDFLRYFARAGGYYNGGVEDAGILVGASIFSRLMEWNTYKMRQYLRLSYTGLFDRITTEQLRIDNPFGLRNFSDPYIRGNTRINLMSETSVYLNYRFLGFRFAPFVALNAVMVTPEHMPFAKSDLYTGIGGGVRTRNENLIFGTLELRGVYFPREVLGQPAFKVLFISNLRFRYNSNYVTRPDILRLNIDDGQ